jgi:hypothetical protein
MADILRVMISVMNVTTMTRPRSAGSSIAGK